MSGDKSVVDVVAQARLDRYRSAAVETTLLVIAVAVLLLAIEAVRDSRRALKESHAAVAAVKVTEHNLCVTTKGILARDRATIRGNPATTAALLRTLGFSDAKIEAFKKKAQPGIDAEIKKRPDLDCEHRAKPVKPKKAAKKP